MNFKMVFRVGKFYEFNGTRDGYKYEGKYVCSAEYSDEEYAFRPISSLFIQHGHGGFVLRKGEKVSHKEIFREMKTDQKKEMFKFAMKIASSGDIDGNLSGSDSNEIQNFEYEYGIFKTLWEIPIKEEKDWLDRMDNDPHGTAGVPAELWFEDEEIIGNALCKLRMVKQYLAEMKSEDSKESTAG